MRIEILLVFVLVVPAMGLTAVILAMAMRGARGPAGALLRLACPVGRVRAAVRVAAHPVTRQLAVVWCERFPLGDVLCAQECLGVAAGNDVRVSVPSVTRA